MASRLLARGCCTTPAAMCYWTAIFVLLYGAGLLLMSVWPDLRPFGDTLILAALGAACFINVHRHRTVHCAITGPLFVLGSVAAALIEGQVWAFDMSIIWGMVLVGVGIAFFIEWWTVGSHQGADACSSSER